MKKLKTILLSYLIAGAMTAACTAACYNPKKILACDPLNAVWPDPCASRLSTKTATDAGSDATKESGQ